MFQRKSPVWTLSILISVVLLQVNLQSCMYRISGYPQDIAIIFGSWAAKFTEQVLASCYYDKVILMLQFLLPNACGQLSIHTPSTCIPECGAGYECVTGLCVRQQCSTDCSGEERQVVCGSNGVNYNNLCELEKARCELALDISLESHGPCKSIIADSYTYVSWAQLLSTAEQSSITCCC